jgi:hypothetical protein
LGRPYNSPALKEARRVIKALRFGPSLAKQEPPSKRQTQKKKQPRLVMVFLPLFVCHRLLRPKKPPVFFLKQLTLSKKPASFVFLSIVLDRPLRSIKATTFAA